MWINLAIFYVYKGVFFHYLKRNAWNIRPTGRVLTEWWDTENHVDPTYHTLLNRFMIALGISSLPRVW